MVVGVALWVSTQAQPNAFIQKKGSALLATFRFLQSYGIVIIVAVITTYLAGRILGSIVEVFISGALGVLLIIIAVRMFASGAPTQAPKG